MVSTSLILLTLVTLASPPERSSLDPVGKVHIPLGLAGGLDSLKSFVEAEGGFSPGFATFGVSYWVFDPAVAKLHAGTDGRRVEHGLNGVGRLVPWTRWSADGVEVWSETCQAEREVGEKTLLFVGARGRLRNTGREPRTVRFTIAIRPIGPAGGPIRSIRLVEGGRFVEINGHLAIAADPAPTMAGAVPTDTIGESARKGLVPDAQDVVSSTGDSSALLQYDLTLSPGESRQFRLVCPVAEVTTRPLSIAELKSVRVDDLFYRAESYWDGIGGRVKLRLPDRRWAEAFAAITSHVSVKNDNVFNRNSFTIATILQQSGRSDLAERVIDACLARPEADDPGQTLRIMGDQWMFTHDRGWLIRVSPAVDDLAAMIASDRTEHRADRVAGLRAAAMLAEVSGDKTKAADRLKLADRRFHEYDTRFGDQLAKDEGTFGVLWPCRLYPTESGRAFDAFHTIGAQEPTRPRSIGLATAHQGLLTRHREAGYRTIDLHLADPQMKDWYAPGETDKSGARAWREARTTWNGDVAMPHLSAIAEFSMLLRDCLAFEDSDQIVLLAGIPPDWFRRPGGFAVESLPTRFGSLSFTYDYDVTTARGVLTTAGDARPPGGFRICIASADGKDRALVIPLGTTTLRFELPGLRSKSGS